jgi:phenylpyruvate tautomerase PptA (4-oxalocrotonate tautomerase family)
VRRSIVGENIDNSARWADDQAIMPIYTCTTTESTLPGPIKAAFAREIATIHSEINHVPSTYVNVVFHELAAMTSTPTVHQPAQSWLAAGYARATRRLRSRDLPPKSPPP